LREAGGANPVTLDSPSIYTTERTVSTVIERFSYSSLSSYQKCPAQFKFRYVDWIRKPDESIEAFMGKRVHETIEYLYTEVLRGKIPLLDPLLDWYSACWTNQWHDRIGIVKRNVSIQEYFQLGQQCIARYYRMYAPFDQPVVENELELVFPLDADRDYMMKGVIDRLDHHGDGYYEIHDYKTGSRAMTSQQADKDGQLALYHYALLQTKEPVKGVQLVWHFLRHGVTVTSTRTKGQLSKLVKQMKGRINEIREKIQKRGSFNPKQSVLCNWCYYWEECPTKRGTNPFVG